jgi:DNA-3-methyladenine glycosylase II
MLQNQAFVRTIEAMAAPIRKLVKPVAKAKGKAKTSRHPAGKSARAMAVERLIKTDDDVAEGVAELSAKCRFAREMAACCGPLPLRLREPGFEGLARIVVSQQVSVASAAAIWGRFSTQFQPMQPAVILAASDDALRGAGLSRPKVRTLRAVATAIVHEGLTLDDLDRASNDDVQAALTRVSGIGPWTADIFLMFCLGRADGFAAGDLALQEAAKMVMQLDARPSAQELLVIAEAWRPWRSVAARLLWAYYKVMKEREGIGA